MFPRLTPNDRANCHRVNVKTFPQFYIAELARGVHGPDQAYIFGFQDRLWRIFSAQVKATAGYIFSEIIRHVCPSFAADDQHYSCWINSILARDLAGVQVVNVEQPSDLDDLFPIKIGERRPFTDRRIHSYATLLYTLVSILLMSAWEEVARVYTCGHITLVARKIWIWVRSRRKKVRNPSGVVLLIIISKSSVAMYIKASFPKPALIISTPVYEPPKALDGAFCKRRQSPQFKRGTNSFPGAFIAMLIRRVNIIFECSPKIQMGRISAGWVVPAWTVMANEQRPRVRSTVQLPCYASGDVGSARAKAKEPIPAGIDAFLPCPAVVRTAYVHGRPKALDLALREVWNWFKLSGSHLMPPVHRAVRAAVPRQKALRPEHYSIMGVVLASI